MAMEDPILFTGKELNFEVPKMTELASAEQRLRDKITKQEDLQTKYQDELRKNINVDTSALVSDFSRKQQYEAVKFFQDKWTKIAKERGNKLTSDDLMEMEKDKSGIANLQNEWKSSQVLWEQDKAMIQKSPGDFDKEKFAADTDSFLSTGQYKPNSLEFSGIDLEDFFTSKPWRGTSYSTETNLGSSGGFDKFETRSGVATKEEAERYILQTILSDTTGRALKGVIKDFMNESPAKKAEVLKDFDENHDGSISPGEMASANVKMSSRDILTNPILGYAKERYLASVMKEKVTTDNQRKLKGAATPADPTAYVTKSWDEDGVHYTQKVPATEGSGDKKEKVDPGIKPVNGKYLLNKGEAGITFTAVDKKGRTVPNAKIDFLGYSKVSSVKACSYNPADKTVTLTIISKGNSISHPIPIEEVPDLPEDIKNTILDQVVNIDDKPVRLRDIAGGDAAETPTNKPKLY